MSGALASSLALMVVDVVVLMVVRGKVARFLAVAGLVMSVLYTIALLIS